MIELIGGNGVYLARGRVIVENGPGVDLARVNGELQRAGLAPLERESLDSEEARGETMAHAILAAHDESGSAGPHLRLRFDALASHDITYVGIIQTARASGLTEFPMPYVLTNCHNSLCAVGGTINEDDHLFGLSAAQKYGGIYVPAHQAVIHQYMREMHAACGAMILGSDSHTRYGALGCMGVGEGGPELVKQLLDQPYDAARPEVIAVYLEGRPAPGVGPQDVALALIKAVFASGFVKNKILEFVGPGIADLSVDYRNGIDVMTTETTCLSSIWTTDDKVAEYYRGHGRSEAYRALAPGDLAYYSGLVRVDLGKIEPMIALPFHPSNAWPIRELNERPAEILGRVEEETAKLMENPRVPVHLTDKIDGGRLRLAQGIIAGCAGGTFENLWTAAEIINGGAVGDGAFALSLYPASQPIYLELIKHGAAEKYMLAGAVLKTAFCGPCFGAGDIPAHDTISGRHTTRNFPNREGSKPGNDQIAYAALMDARSIAATALHGGRLTAATELDRIPGEPPAYEFDRRVYKNRVYFGFGRPEPETPLRFGPNIADWPEISPLPENLLLKVVAVIDDPVTTTDELIPSGETSSYRSNPLKLAEFTLSRKDPGYVKRAKEVQAMEAARRAGDYADLPGFEITGIGSAVAARKPGDGSAREQAASCQRVLGGWANIALDYATKRYRSNLVNWGMLPFVVDEEVFAALETGENIVLPGVRAAVAAGAEEIEGVLVRGDEKRPIKLRLPGMTEAEREIVLAGCLMNYYAGK